MNRIRIAIAATVSAMSPLSKGLCTGLVATATVAAGGAATINDETTVALKLYVGGIIAACSVGIWVGTRVGKLLEMVNTMRRVERLVDSLNDRVQKIEQNCSANWCAVNSKTQRVHLDDN